MPYSLRSDTFNRANGYLTSEGWSQVSPLPRLAISSNQVIAGHEYGVGYWAAAYWSGDTFGDRQFSQFQIVNAAYATSIVPFVRGQLASPGTCYGFGYGGDIVVDLYDIENDDGMVSLLVTGRISYYDSTQPGTDVGVFQVGGGSTVYTGNYRLFSKFKLEKYVEGVQTVLAEYLLDAGILYDGIVIGLKSDGTVLTPYLGGNYLDPVADASLSGGIVGIAIYEYASYTNYKADNWTGGGDLTTSEISGIFEGPKCSASGSVSSATSINILPVPPFSVTGLGGIHASGEVSLPQLTVEGSVSLGVYGDFTLPQFDIAGTGYTENHALGDVTLPQFSVDGSGSLEDFAAGSFTLPALTYVGSGYINAEVSGSLTLPQLSIEGSIYIEVYGEGELSLPQLTIRGSAYLSDDDDIILKSCYDVWGAGSIEFPQFEVDGEATVE
jgi:hypothetical protein